MTSDDARVGELLRRWVDDGAPAVSAAEARSRAGTIALDEAPAGDGGPRRGLLVAAAALVVVLVAAVALVVRGGRDQQVPVVTDTPTPTAARHHYRVDFTDPALADQREHAEYQGYLHGGLVWTTRARLYADGRIDATVEATADGAALVSVPNPLTDDEQRLLLGTQGRLGVMYEADPERDPLPCPGVADEVKVVSGAWPAWTVDGCASAGPANPLVLGQVSEDDPDLIVIDRQGPFVRRTDGAAPVVHAELGDVSPPWGCVDPGGCLGVLAVTLDGTVIDGPRADRALSRAFDVPVVDDAHGWMLAAILATGAYPGAVSVTDLGIGAPPATMAPKHPLGPTGSSPESPTTTGLRTPIGTVAPGAVPLSSDGAALTVSVGVAGGLAAPGATGPRPVEGATVVVEGNGQRATATTAADGRVLVPVTVGRWWVGPPEPVAAGVTVIVLTPKVHEVTLSNHIK